jgi:hypothetical protein
MMIARTHFLSHSVYRIGGIVVADALRLIVKDMQGKSVEIALSVNAEGYLAVEIKLVEPPSG